MNTHSEMSSSTLGDYLRRIRLTRSIPAPQALADEIEQRFPNDEATPRLVAAIGKKLERLSTRN